MQLDSRCTLKGSEDFLSTFVFFQGSVNIEVPKHTALFLLSFLSSVAHIPVIVYGRSPNLYKA